MHLYSIVVFHFRNLFNKKNCLITISCLLVYCLSSILLYGTTLSLDKSVYFVFYAPKILLLDLFRALLLILSFLLICSHFIQNEISERSSYIILRIRSKKTYLNSMFLVMTLFVFIFMFIGYVIAIISTLIFDSYEHYSTTLVLNTINIFAIFQQYFLLVLSVISLILLNNVIILLIKNIEIATMILIMVFIGSFYFISIYPKYYIYIPFLYGFLDFQFNKYYIAVIILCISNIILYTIFHLIYRGERFFYKQRR